MRYIETERLIIRHFTSDDLDAIHHILDVDVKMDDLTRDERQTWLNWTILNYAQLERMYQPPYGERAIVLKENNTLIGAVGYVACLMPFGQIPAFQCGGQVEQKMTAEFGLFWTVGSDYQKKGYATEAAKAVIQHAFTALNLKRIVATTEYDNEASIAVMRKAGMTITRNPFPDPPWMQIVGIIEHP